MNCNIKLILENLYGTNFGKLEFSTDIDLYILATRKQRIWREVIKIIYLTSEGPIPPKKPSSMISKNVGQCRLEEGDFP